MAGKNKSMGTLGEALEVAMEGSGETGTSAVETPVAKGVSPDPAAPLAPVIKVESKHESVPEASAVPAAPVSAPVPLEASEASAAPKARHTLKGDVSAVGNFMSRGVRALARKDPDKKSKAAGRPSPRRGKLRSLAAALILVVVVGGAVIWVARSAAASAAVQTLNGAKKIVSAQTDALTPYVAPADTSARTMKMLAYPSTPMWLLWARRAPRIETGLVTRMTMPGATEPFAHSKEGKWYEGSGPDLKLPSL